MKVFINPGHSPNGVPDPGASNAYTHLRECDVAKAVGDLVEKYLAACLVVQAHRRTTAGRFSAAGLTHHAKRFPAIDCK